MAQKLKYHPDVFMHYVYMLKPQQEAAPSTTGKLLTTHFQLVLLLECSRSIGNARLKLSVTKLFYVNVGDTCLSTAHNSESEPPAQTSQRERVLG